MQRQLAAWGVAALVVVGAAIGRTVSGHPTTPSALPVQRRVPAFSLADQRGGRVSQQDLAGRVWVANFIFTSCPGQCPLMTEQFRALQRLFAQAQDLRFVSFSVDPLHDTPEVLAAYAARYGADARWWLVTGSRDELFTLCREGFGLAVEAQPASSREPITHSVRFVLVDRMGQLRGSYDATDTQAMARLRQHLRQLLEERA